MCGQPLLPWVQALIGALEADEANDATHLATPARSHRRAVPIEDGDAEIDGLIGCFADVVAARSAEDPMRAADHAAKIEHALDATRRAIERNEPAGRTIKLRVMVRLVQGRHRSVRASPVGLRPGTRRDNLSVHPRAYWFRMGRGPVIDMRRKWLLRRLLSTLVERRVNTPGVAISIEALVDAGWPDQTIQPQAAIGRLYTAIGCLRQLGLHRVILNEEAGYLLDPSVGIAVEEVDAEC